MNAGTTRETEVFREAYAMHVHSLLRLAYLLTGSREIAEDVVHDVFARTGRRLAAIDDPAPYLRRSVINDVRSRHRRHLVARRHDAPAPVDVLDDVELTELRDVLRLPARQRAAIVLRYLYQQSEAEIADAIGCRPSTVRTLVKRGLERLRLELS